MKPFVHLHVHSYYSVLDGQASIEALVDKAIADGMPGIALTDHGSMFGIKNFYNYVGKKNGAVKNELKALDKELAALRSAEGDNEAAIAELETRQTALRKKIFKPILGCEAYCARRTRHDKDPQAMDPYKPGRSIDSSGWHIVLLAKNLQGYRNLIKIVSYSWTEGYYYRPRIDKELLEQYHEGLIVTSACLGGEIPQHILAGQIDEARKSIMWFKSVFGDDFYLEIQRHETHNPLANQTTYPEQVKVNQILLELAAELGVGVVATNDVHFANEDDGESHDRLICLNTGKELSDPNRMRYSKQEWLKTTAEMNAIFADVPETLERTLEVLDKVEEYSIDSAPLMPNFEIPEGFADANDYLRHLTYLGGERKYGEGFTQEVRDRIDFELETVRNMGFPGYFLIVWDFIRAAREMGVLVGPGRGSAAGSVVAYCLDITDLDPLKYNLLFERFLNPDRISMPDMDIDFDDDGRMEVLKWVTEKYGHDKVAHICTYGTMGAKSAFKDVARVHRYPLQSTTELCKLIPDKLEGVKKVTLEVALEREPKLKAVMERADPDLRDVVKHAKALDGCLRNIGVHACGMIIGRDPISDVVPVFTQEDKITGEKQLVTQYEGGVIEETGLIKMDFLGLKTLSVIKETLYNIKQTRGIDLDINKIPIDDEKTYKLYSQGRTVGTFQFESGGMQKYLRELEPTRFEDLVAMNALYRPGPMDYIPDFVARKHGREPITYDLPEMEEVLRDTYGVTVYQEQVMLLSRKLAGFTRGQSDNLRKAMGKKQIEKMNELKVQFLEGGVANGYPEATLTKIWADWEKFASYAFNKSHAACYSWVSYQTGYLKANYPSEYMAGALSRNLDDITQIAKLMDECRSMGIKVLVPDVNESGAKFAVNKDGNIRFGLSAIKGVGGAVVEQIIAEREAHGPYTDIYDLMERVDLSKVNKKVFESLIYAGAFDGFGLKRELYFQPMSHVQNKDDNFLLHLIRYGASVQEERFQQEVSLFGGDEEAMQIQRPTPPTEMLLELSELEILELERNHVGLYLSTHPLAPYEALLRLYSTSCQELKELDSLSLGSVYRFGGIVTKAFHGTTKKGNPYGRVSIEDSTGIVEFALFAKNYLDLEKYMRPGLQVYATASVQKRFGSEELELRLDKIMLLSEANRTLMERVDLSIPLDCLTPDTVDELAQIIRKNPGHTQLYLHVVNHENIETSFAYDQGKLAPSTELLNFCRRRGIGISVS